MPRPTRVDIDSRQFVVGTLAGIEDIRKEAEAFWIAEGDAITTDVRSAWPVGEARTRRASPGEHTRDGITGKHRRTKAGRLVYEIRVPFPAGFLEFGTRHIRRRSILRRRMLASRARLAGK